MNAKQEKALEKRIRNLQNRINILRESLALIKQEKKSLEKDLKTTNGILNKLPGGVVLVQDGIIKYTNKIPLERLGYSENEMIGKQFVEFVHPRSREFVLNVYKKRIAGKPAPIEYETYLASKSGEAFCCQVLVTKIRHKGSNAVLVNIIGLDDKKREERQLAQNEKKEALVRMASGLSRELKDCVNAVAEQASNLKDIEYVEQSGLGETSQRLEAAVEKGNLMAHRLDILADFERQKQGSVLFDLRKTVKDAVSQARQSWKKLSGNPEAETQFKTYLRTISPVEGDPEEIKEAIVCIISNALEALPSGGEIYLTMEENAGFANIYLQDSGPGIEEKIKDKVFDPFFTTKKGDHPGLGLSMAQAVINRHGGDIEFVGLEGQGATCSIRIPLTQKAEVSKVRKPRKRISNSHLLIVSFEGMVKDILAQLFTSKKGKVTVVSKAAKGLKLLRKTKFDLIIVDLNTPGLEPVKIIPQIKNTKQGLPLVLVNAGKRGIPSRSLKKLGADLIIKKPLDMDRTVRLVSELLA